MCLYTVVKGKKELKGKKVTIYKLYRLSLKQLPKKRFLSYYRNRTEGIQYFEVGKTYKDTSKRRIKAIFARAYNYKTYETGFHGWTNYRDLFRFYGTYDYPVGTYLIECELSDLTAYGSQSDYAPMVYVGRTITLKRIIHPK